MNIKKDKNGVMSIRNNVYQVKGSNVDHRGADDGSKLIQCYDLAVCTTQV